MKKQILALSLLMMAGSQSWAMDHAPTDEEIEQPSGNFSEEEFDSNANAALDAFAKQEVGHVVPMNVILAKMNNYLRENDTTQLGHYINELKGLLEKQSQVKKFLDIQVAVQIINLISNEKPLKIEGVVTFDGSSAQVLSFEGYQQIIYEYNKSTPERIDTYSVVAPETKTAEQEQLKVVSISEVLRKMNPWVVNLDNADNKHYNFVFELYKTLKDKEASQKFVDAQVAQEIYQIIGTKFNHDNNVPAQVSMDQVARNSKPTDSNTFTFAKYTEFAEAHISANSAQQEFVNTRKLTDSSDFDSASDSGSSTEEEDVNTGQQDQGSSAATQQQQQAPIQNQTPKSKPSIFGSKWVKFGGPTIIVAAASYVAWQKYASTKQVEIDLDDEDSENAQA